MIKTSSSGSQTTDPITERISIGKKLSLTADIYPHPDPRAVVLLLHGGGQNRHAWQTTAHRLHALGYTVIAYDARGHGDSDWDPKGLYDIDRLASDLLAVRAHTCSGHKAVAIGASMGGLTILGTHLVAAPELWEAIVLVDITPRMELQGARRVIQPEPPPAREPRRATQSTSPTRRSPMGLAMGSLLHHVEFSIPARRLTGRRRRVRGNRRPTHRRRTAYHSADAAGPRTDVRRRLSRNSRRIYRPRPARPHRRYHRRRPHDRRR